MYYMWFVRNQKGIETALERLQFIEKHVAELKALNLHELMCAHEALNIIRHYQLSATAAPERKETGRAIYKRSDYPNLDPELEKCPIIWQENGSVKSTFEPLKEANDF